MALANQMKGPCSAPIFAGRESLEMGFSAACPAGTIEVGFLPLFHFTVLPRIGRSWPPQVRAL